ncbi:MAG TPA: serine hydrolase [Chitinophagales bacterium]|nr:serine hydrolase [Chitinophagales bacterium]
MKKIMNDIRASHRHTIEIIFAILAALLFILLAKFAFGQQSISEKDVSRIAGGYTSDKINHALVIGIINGSNVQYFTYGEIEKGTGSKPSAQSVFQLGTVSCVYTTSLLSLFDEQGKVNLTDPIQNYFPQAVHIPVYQKIICSPPPEPIHYPTILNCYPDPMYHPKQIVLCDLSTHTSGLPETPFNLHENRKDAYANYSLDDLYRFLNSFRPNFQTGLHYEFSPLGIAMLANGFSWKFNTDFESLLKTNLLSPLQLPNTFITGNEEQRMQQIPGHDKKGKKMDDIKYGVMAPALSIHSSAEDLVKFVSANLYLKDSVMRSALRTTQQPKVAILYSKKLRDSYGGMGWMISPLKANSPSKIVWQSSAMNGYACYIGFVNESKTGVVVLSNSVQPVDEIGKKILLLLNAEIKSAGNPPGE